MRAAAVQLTATADRDRNLDTADRLTREAAAARRRAGRAAREVVGLRARPRTSSRAPSRSTGPRSRGRAATARELGIDLVAGSIAERVEGARARRQHLRARRPRRRGPRGVPQAAHVRRRGRRARLPRVRASRRRATSSCSRRRPDGVELGLSICYDLRFPELYRILAVRGARVLTVPAAFTLTTTREHWEVLLRARAIEDQCFVIAANQSASTRRASGRRALDDRRPVGHRARAGARRRDLRASPTSTSSARREIRARSCPSLANRRPVAYRWPEEAPPEAWRARGRPSTSGG